VLRKDPVLDRNRGDPQHSRDCDRQLCLWLHVGPCEKNLCSSSNEHFPEESLHPQAGHDVVKEEGPPVSPFRFIPPLAI
jgi:hypothetical protein